MPSSRSRFSIPAQVSRLGDLETLTSAHDLWTDPVRAQGLILEQKSIRRIVGPIQDFRASLAEYRDLVELADESDRDVLIGVFSLVPGLEKTLSDLDHKFLYRHPDDPRDAIVTVQAGAGGVDAMDWAAQLERMYLRFLESEGFAVTVTDRLEGSTAGIHHVELEVKGPFAYGRLRGERGTHRIQHVSAFDSNGKKQTSFAAVDVLPLHPESAVELDEKDLEIDTFCSGGPGGQNVNKVATAVRVTHVPTGLVAKCQSSRSQHQNKATALKILATKLRSREDEKKEKRVKIEASFGHQIRTYVTEPYQLVKDHRTGFETSATKNVLGGELAPLIESYLRLRA